MTKVIGLIGGMSWQTTAVYYEEINRRVAAKLGGIHSATVLLKSLDYAHVAEAVSMGNFQAFTDMLSESGRELRAAGAQALVLCANVAHRAADAVEGASGLPVLHVVDFTAREIVDVGFRRVGLLATRAVMEEDFYKSRLRDRFGLEVVVPDQAFRARADDIIFNEMSKPVIPADVVSTWHAAFAKLVQDEGVECIILACTELRLVFDVQAMSVPVFETTVLHARGVADWSLS